MTVPTRIRPQAKDSLRRGQDLSDPNRTIENVASSMNEPKLWQQLLPMIIGSWVARAIDVAATLRVAHRMAAGPRAAGPLYRVLRALAGVGVFAPEADGRSRDEGSGGALGGRAAAHPGGVSRRSLNGPVMNAEGL
jgi:hypothetical protein